MLGLVIVYSCQKEISCEGCVDGNKPPIAVAGPDQVVTLPTDSVLLNGNSSSDPDGTITKWLWTKISGPASFSISRPSDSTTKVKSLLIGTYQFELTVSDNSGLSAKDTVQIIVKDPLLFNRPPIANAGSDQTINLPTNIITLIGNGSTDPDNNIISYLWTKISGPSSFNIGNAHIVQTTVANLIEGVYGFELKVTDAGGLFSKDTMQVTVNHEPNNSPVDIYVSGSENGVPVYWKNGQAIPLDNGPSYYSGSSITVVGNDVCVAGMKSGLMWNEYAGKYWKNGQEVTLGNIAGASSIALSGNDVYVAGWEYIATGFGAVAVAKYWKNGQPVSLTNGASQAYANSIVVVGADIYVAGEEGEVAKYWKNGHAVSLTNGSSAWANSIVVIGSDVYVAGYEGGIAKYWKNGQAVSLSQGNATSIAVVGSDVYVAGYTHRGQWNSVAKYWKNGHEVPLTSGSEAFATSIAVVEGDVYVAGQEYKYNETCCAVKYWKNGQAVPLTTGSNTGWAGGIVVIKH